MEQVTHLVGSKAFDGRWRIKQNLCRTNFAHNKNYINVRNNYTIANDQSRLLTWLSSLGPRIPHRGIQECQVDNVGEWLTQTKEFRRLYSMSGEGEGDKSVLFFYGDLGAGKTLIR